jgi:hypothetical protein
VRRPFWMRRRKESATLLPLSPLLLDLFVSTSLHTQPLQVHAGENIDQWEVEAVGQQRKRVSDAYVKSCQWRRLELRSWSLAMSCMLKGGEKKRVRGAVTASTTTCIMSRTPSIVLCVKWSRWVHTQLCMLVGTTSYSTYS